jgi:lysozyme family protein
MADFHISFYKTLKSEGVYSNNINDKGGETYCGIARNIHPHWEGWPIIDELKSNGFSIFLHQDKLAKSVEEFYKKEYWGLIRGNDLPQDLADELFDTAVNEGPGIAIMFLQQGLNALNRNGKLYQDIVEDGGFGDITLNALNTYLLKDKLNILLKILNVLQGFRYLSILKHNPSQEDFIRGWFERVKS